MEAGGAVTFHQLVEGGGISVERRYLVVLGVMLVNWV